MISKSIVPFFVFSLIISFLSGSCVVQNKTQSSSVQEQWTPDQLRLISRFHLAGISTIYNSRNRFQEQLPAAEFGHKLFFDKRLSSNNKVACSSCHKPENYFTDNLKTAKGIQQTSRNTPTIVAAANASWFFHDGRADSLWSQALGPLENPLEHGSNRSNIAHLIHNNPELRKGYEFVFGAMPDISDKEKFPLNAGPVADRVASNNWSAMSAENQKVINDIFVNVGKSLAAYESKLSFSESRFDQYITAVMNNDFRQADRLLNKNEVSGLRLFIGKANCILCHSGPLFSDDGFHNIATVDAAIQPLDLGRYEGVKALLKSDFNCRSRYNDTQNDACEDLKYMSQDQHQTLASFKTPGLRNITKTAPYMHDGQFETLKDVVNHYHKPDKLIIGQKDLLVIQLTDQNKKDLVAFLKTLDSPIKSDSRWLSAPK